MGTNYYARMNRCEHCGRGEDRHVGKAYRTLRAYPEDGIMSWQDWLDWLNAVEPTIVNEYDEVIDFGTFIEGWKPIPGNREVVSGILADWRGRFGSDSGDYVDAEGFHLMVRPFS
jgi:hypothetical protein